MPAPGWNQSSAGTQPGLGTLRSQEKGAGGSRMGWTQGGADTGAQGCPQTLGCTHCHRAWLQWDGPICGCHPPGLGTSQPQIQHDLGIKNITTSQHKELTC